MGANGSLFIVDVSDPTNPTQVGTLDVGSPIRSIQVVSGNASQSSNAFTSNLASTQAFVVVGVEFKVIDVSTPSNPAIENEFETPPEVESMSISGNNLYLVTREEVWRYALSDNGRAIFQNRFPSDGSNLIVAQGDFIYVADLDSSMTIFDVSDPNNPVQRGTFSTSSIIQDMQVRDGIAYVIPASLESGDHKPEVVDVSDPLNPTKMGELNLAGAGIDLFVPPGSGLAKAGAQTRSHTAGAGTHVIYVALFNQAGGNGGLQIIDVANPSSPTSVSTAQTAGKAVAATQPNSSTARRRLRTPSMPRLGST